MAPSIKRLYHSVARETLVPLALMISTVNLVLLIPYIIVYRKANLVQTLSNERLIDVLKSAWLSVDFFDKECWLIIVGTLLWGITTLVVLPGKKYYGPPTSNNFKPEYWNNGFKFYLLTMAIVTPLIWKYSVLHLYYKIPTFMAILAIFGLLFCTFLYIKALIAPDPGIYDRTNNPIFDFYWGIELYPCLGNYVSLKVLINCRFGLLLWQLIVLLAWKANYELYMGQYRQGKIVWPITTNTILQTVYLAKFYYWEDGYMRTIDTAVDRFGFYIAWGCIAFVPGFYTLSSIYLVKNSPVVSYNGLLCTVILIVGLASILANYWVDRQKKIFRETDGNCVIWGKSSTFIRAKYQDDFGKEQNSILLASGFWSISRHSNYMFEIILALMFSLPALFSSIIPHLYFLFIFVLLVHRSLRDEEKCSTKYGRYWKEYCKQVPFKIFPGLY